MAEVKTTTIWNSLRVDEYVDTDDGSMEITQRDGTEKGRLLASAGNYVWTIDNLPLFLQLYNSRQGSETLRLTSDEFQSLFYRQAVPIFNNDRSRVLLDRGNFNGNTDWAKKNTAFFISRVPGVQNPVTGQLVNNDGDVTEGNPYASNIDENLGEDTGGVGRTNVTGNGSANVPSDGSTYRDPNDGVKASLRAVPEDVSTGDDRNGNSSNAKAGNRSARSSMRMVYPEANLGKYGYDYIQITAHKYSTEGRTLSGGPGGSSEQRLGAPQGTVQLPMQPNLEETSSVDWGQDTLNLIQAELAQAAMGAIGNLANFDVVGGVQNLLSDLGNSASNILKDQGNEAFLKAYFAGQAVGANITARSTGQVINPNLELLFSGPKLRTFNFNFKLTPRSQSEAQTCKQIIKFFKKNMAPDYSDSGLYLYTPNIFKLEYISNGAPHPYMNKIKPCALVNCRVNYTPDNVYMTYVDGSMTSYSINLQFGELDPIYSRDHDGVAGTGY